MSHRLVRAGLHAAAAAVVLVAIVAQVWRPLAPPVGALPSPEAFFPAALLARIDAYRRPLQLLAPAALVVRVGVPLLLALTPAGRRAVAAVVTRAGPQRPVLAATAVIVLAVVAIDLLLLPAAFWSGYVHDRAFGLRTGGVGGWIRDWSLSVLPGWAAAGVLTAGGWALARRLPSAWPAVAGLLAAGLGAVVVLLTPLLLEPLRYGVAPLPAGAARSAVEEVLDAATRSGDRILVAEASARTTRANAYVSGLAGTRQVVLYDTLVQSRPPEEIALVVAHELAHDLHADLPRSVLLGGAGSVTTAYVLAALLRRRARAGRQDGQTDPRAAAVVLAAVVLLTTAALPLQNAISRRAEAAADHTALRLTGDPATFQALTLSLVAANLADPAPPTWVQWLLHTHPSPVERLVLARRSGPEHP